MRIMGAICVINKTTDGVKIMRDRFINDEEGKINKWFSVNKTSDAKIGEERQALKEEEAKKRKESFERLGELLMPTIFEELKIGEINRGDDD